MYLPQEHKKKYSKPMRSICQKHSMEKKRCWFGWWRRLFGYDTRKPKAEQKSKRWRCGGFGRVKLKQCPASLPAPMNPIDEATEKQKNYALTVAFATATAAEAAVAAAQAAAEVVRLTAGGTSRSYLRCGKEQCNLAAIKIQSAFRAYLVRNVTLPVSKIQGIFIDVWKNNIDVGVITFALEQARKALRALKGLVKLQALIRGSAVRRQLVYDTKSVQSNAVKTRTNASLNENKQFLNVKTETKENRSKIERSSEHNHSSTSLPKEDMEAARFKKQEATHKRGSTTEYSRREKRNMKTSEETLSVLDRQGQWLRQWAQKEYYSREGLENLRPIAVRKSKDSDVGEAAEVKSRYHTKKHDAVEVLSSPMSLARRSFCRPRKSFVGEERSVPNSPVVFPTYMAATQSAKAKARSISTPRQRIGLHNVCIDHGLYHKNGVSFWSFQDGELFGGHDSKTSSKHEFPTSVPK